MGPLSASFLYVTEDEIGVKAVKYYKIAVIQDLFIQGYCLAEKKILIKNDGYYKDLAINAGYTFYLNTRT